MHERQEVKFMPVLFYIKDFQLWPTKNVISTGLNPTVEVLVLGTKSAFASITRTLFAFSCSIYSGMLY